MTKIESKIGYTLEVDPTGKDHKFAAENSIENDIAALLMTERLLSIQIQMYLDRKKEKGVLKEEKQLIQKIIGTLHNGLKAVRPLASSMLENYHQYKEHESKMLKETESLKSE